MAVIVFKDNSADFLRAMHTANGKVLSVIGALIQGDAIENSPKRTGALQQSWIVEVDTDKQTVTIGVPLDALDGNYAKYVEAGTTRQQPKHMLQNAVNSARDQIPGLAEAEYKNA